MVRSQRECIACLERIRWSGVPKCPYCGSEKSSAIEDGLRHHCNDCYTSYSVMVGTLFHRTHIDLQKWFRAIQIFFESSEGVSARKLAREIGVTNNTASSMIKRIRKAMTIESERQFLQTIASMKQSNTESKSDS